MRMKSLNVNEIRKGDSPLSSMGVGKYRELKAANVIYDRSIPAESTTLKNDTGLSKIAHVLSSLMGSDEDRLVSVRSDEEHASRNAGTWWLVKILDEFDDDAVRTSFDEFSVNYSEDWGAAHVKGNGIDRVVVDMGRIPTVNEIKRGRQGPVGVGSGIAWIYPGLGRYLAVNPDARKGVGSWENVVSEEFTDAYRHLFLRASRLYGWEEGFLVLKEDPDSLSGWEEKFLPPPLSGEIYFGEGPNRTRSLEILTNSRRDIIRATLRTRNKSADQVLRQESYLLFQKRTNEEVNEISRGLSALGSIGAGSARLLAYGMELKKKYGRLPVVAIDALPPMLRNRTYVAARMLGIDESEMCALALSKSRSKDAKRMLYHIKREANAVPEDDVTTLTVSDPRGESRGRLRFFWLDGAVAVELGRWDRVPTWPDRPREGWYLFFLGRPETINEIKRDASPLGSMGVGKHKMLAYNILMNTNPQSVTEATDTVLDNDVLWLVRDQIVAPSLGCYSGDVGVVLQYRVSSEEYDDLINGLDEHSGVTETLNFEDGSVTVKSWGDHSRGIWITEIAREVRGRYDDEEPVHWVRIPSVNEVKRGGKPLSSMGVGMMATSPGYDSVKGLDPDLNDVAAVTSWPNSFAFIPGLLGCSRDRVMLAYADVLSDELRDAVHAKLHDYPRTLASRVETRVRTPYHQGITEEVWVTASTEEGVAFIEKIEHTDDGIPGHVDYIALRLPTESRHRVDEVRRGDDALRSLRAGSVASGRAYDEIKAEYPKLMDRSARVQVGRLAAASDHIARELECHPSRLIYLIYRILPASISDIVERYLDESVEETVHYRPVNDFMKIPIKMRSNSQAGIAIVESPRELTDRSNFIKHLVLRIPEGAFGDEYVN